MSPMFTRSASLACAVLLAGLSAARAESVPLPVERPVDGDVELDLRHSRLEVLVSHDREPRVEVFDARGREVEGGFVVIEQGEAGALVLRQPYGADEVAPDLVVRLVVPPARGLSIRGDRLDIDIEAERTPAGRPASGGSSLPPGGRGAGSSRSAISLDVDDSSARITRVAGLDIEGTGGHFDLASTSGAVTVRLDQASLQVADHRGSLRLAGRGLDVEALEVGGTLQAMLDGGGLTVRGGNGRLDVDLRGGQLVAERWQGPVKIVGRDGGIEVREMDDSGTTVRVDLTDVQVRVESIAGGLSGQVRAGRFEGRDIAGAVNLTGREGAEIELEGLGQACRLDLQDGGRARVKGIAARLQARLTDAELTAESMLELDLKAERSVADLGGVGRQLRIVALDSDVDLDGGDVRGQAELQARGTSALRVRLPLPCEVHYDGSEDARDALSVDGCELVARGQRRPRVLRPRGARPPAIVEVKVEPGASVEVTGGP